MRMPLALGRKVGAAKVPMESIEEIVNGYLEVVPEGKEPTPIYGTPGLISWCTGLNGRPRGWFAMVGTLYVVSGDYLYRVDASGVETNLGTIPGLDDVDIDGDGTNLVIVASGSIYVYDGATLALVTDPDAPPASGVCWVDGYFLFPEVGTEQFFICGLDAPTDYDALDFASAEWKPDLIVAAIVLKRTVFLAGQQTLEAQQNTGGADFPFARYQDIFVDVGLSNRDAITSTTDTLFWFCNDDTIRRLDGLTPTKISDFAVGKEIKSWADKTATIASWHVWEEHLFIQFWNPDGCVVFDQATETWHKRRSYGSDTWQVSRAIECYGLKLFMSATEGTIYRADAEAYDEDGDILPFQVITPYAYAKGLELSIDDVEIIAQTGVGTLTLDPQVMLERTHDGEEWFGRQSRGLGKTGERQKRLTYGPQGSSRGAAFKVSITDPVKRAILGVYVEAEPE